MEARLGQGLILEKLLEGFSLICRGICALGPPRSSPAEKLMLYVVACEMKTDALGMHDFPQPPCPAARGVGGWSCLCQHPAQPCPRLQGLEAAIKG